jgi:hypothetical protein
MRKTVSTRAGQTENNLIPAHHIRGTQLGYADKSSDCPTTMLRAWLARAQESLCDHLQERWQTSEVWA